ncbi:MAG: hypothetical protein ACREOZ_03885 [Gloeomargaritales cyanobacterium]
MQVTNNVELSTKASTENPNPPSDAWEYDTTPSTGTGTTFTEETNISIKTGGFQDSAPTEKPALTPDETQDRHFHARPGYSHSPNTSRRRTNPNQSK